MFGNITTVWLQPIYNFEEWRQPEGPWTLVMRIYSLLDSKVALSFVIWPFPMITPFASLSTGDGSESICGQIWYLVCHQNKPVLCTHLQYLRTVLAIHSQSRENIHLDNMRGQVSGLDKKTKGT